MEERKLRLRTPHGLLALACQRRVLQHDPMHLRSQEAVQRFRWRVDDRLVLVERRIEHDRDASLLAEGVDQGPVARVLRLRDTLQAAGAVDVGYGGDLDFEFRISNFGFKGGDRFRMGKLHGGTELHFGGESPPRITAPPETPRPRRLPISVLLEACLLEHRQDGLELSCIDSWKD